MVNQSISTSFVLFFLAVSMLEMSPFLLTIFSPKSLLIQSYSSLKMVQTTATLGDLILSPSNLDVLFPSFDPSLLHFIWTSLVGNIYVSVCIYVCVCMHMYIYVYTHTILCDMYSCSYLYYTFICIFCNK